MKEKKGSQLTLYILYLLPKNLISRLTGYLAALYLPLWIRRPLFRWYINYYQVTVEESEAEPLSYPSLNQFFTRRLKSGVRPIDQRQKIMVSPVDARVSQFGRIENDLMIQAKGIDYSVADLLATPEFTSRFIDGVYMTLYLSPPDYHRIHSPCDGKIIASSYLPGQLFPVNDVAVNGVQNLFPRNERLITFIESPYGLVAVVKVGAVNVGKISVVYDEIVSNGWSRRIQRNNYSPEIEIQKGEELGCFELGSTVILLAEKGVLKLDQGIRGHHSIKLGEPLGSFA